MTPRTGYAGRKGKMTTKRRDTGMGGSPGQTVNGWRLNADGTSVKVGPWARLAKGGTVKTKKKDSGSSGMGAPTGTGTRPIQLAKGGTVKRKK